MTLGLLLSSNVYGEHQCIRTLDNGNKIDWRDLEGVKCTNNKHTYNKEHCSCVDDDYILPIEDNNLITDEEIFENATPHVSKDKIKLDKFNSKRNKQFGIIVIFLLILTSILIKFKKKIEYRISKLTKLDKGLFRVWITLSILWFLASLFYLINEWNLLFFHYDGFGIGNTYYHPEHTPFHAFFSILIVCVLPSFLVVLSWLIIKWIRRGFK